MSTCDSVDFHFDLLCNSDWPNEEMGGRGRIKEPGKDFAGHGRLYRLHGNVKQSERVSTFRDFCKASSGVMICTDVAARGLDLPSVNWIVQVRTAFEQYLNLCVYYRPFNNSFIISYFIDLTLFVFVC